eukprot:gnl/TRDRNA2_/TRDRNA2_154731_c1_seq4.p1 gnl/TRDRNA2_/TRDRNA2_154731_c1~~gnl/TRDRNA2_/TRDRNA2_154731_c1_seq4.p1  ORF type:complete len:449 (-),score=103.46 gnl/TRDRNA2_/TRDRNA2_154731_c1_seq4:111-1457(-)
MGARSSSLEGGACAAVDWAPKDAVMRSRSTSASSGASVSKRARRGHALMLCSPESQLLFKASVQGNYKMASQALTSRADPNSCNEDGLTPLMMAAAGGHHGLAELLVTAGAKAQCGPSLHGLTALSLAASRGDEDIVKLLLDWKADISGGTLWGMAPLASAATAGHPEMCKKLLRAKAQIDGMDRRGATPVMMAVDFGRLEAVKLLVEESASLDRVDRRGRSALTRAVDKMLALPTANRWQPTKAGVPPVFAPVEYWADVCALIAERSADVDLIDATGETLLSRTVRHRRVDVAKVLLDIGATCDLPVPAIKSATALVLAADLGCRDICALLVRYMASLSKTGSDGRTPLTCAVMRGDDVLARYLLDSGASATDVGHDGIPVLMRAAEGGCGLAIYGRLLSSAGGVPSVAESGGKQPTTWSYVRGDEEEDPEEEEEEEELEDLEDEDR